MSEPFYHDHETLEAFVRALARATPYKSHPLGFEDSIDVYWSNEAQEWVKELDSRLAPTLPVSASRVSQETIARKLAGYDDCIYAAEVGELDHDDTVKFCPNCEKPNQFGELCIACSRDEQEAIDAGERWAEEGERNGYPFGTIGAETR